MELLTSKKFILPKVFFITERSEIKDIPIGIPFIIGSLSIKNVLIRVLEYEVLYQRALLSGYPFNFKQILLDNGYLDIKDLDYTFGTAPRIEFSSENYLENEELDLSKPLYECNRAFTEYVKDSSCYVDIEKLKQLNVFPIWLTDNIEKAITTNIHNYASFDYNLYNKKLEGVYGALELKSPGKNLIIIDISSSIPKAVSTTCLALAKNLSESFYADLLITGSKSILYHYENIYELNVETIYEMGMNNDQSYFKKLLTSEEKIYNTAIVFGDNDHPGHAWSGRDKKISDTDGKKLCKWKIDKLISFHTKGTDDLAGYSRWFSPKQEERVSDWVKYLNK